MIKLGVIIGFCIGFLCIRLIISLIPNIIALRRLSKSDIPIEVTLSEKLPKEYIALIEKLCLSPIYYSKFYQRLLVFVKLIILILSFVLVIVLAVINFSELGSILNMEV